MLQCVIEPYTRSLISAFIFIDLPIQHLHKNGCVFLQIVAIPKEDRKYVGLAYPVAQKDPVLTRLQYLHSPGSML